MSEVFKIIGYSGLDLFEGCYGYNENACYIADTEVSAHDFMKYASFNGKYRIESVTLARIMNDFGCSSGEFAMEKNALARFRVAAKEAGIEFKSCDLEDYDNLTLVNVECKRLKSIDRTILKTF